MKSLDPRVNRLPALNQEIQAKAALDQLGTFEVFVQAKENKPFQHEGIVHASDIELAFVLAKETFTRRFTCISLFVTDTRDVYVSTTTEGNISAYDTLPPLIANDQEREEEYLILHLLKRGKQHVLVGEVTANSPQAAMHKSKETLNDGKPVFNVWAIRKSAIRLTQPEEMVLWNTLPEKKYRDAADYKAGDKLTRFLAQQKN
jgi:ring-1,2-phenylacetyl-CoA epoxidase subunit PaaB